MRKIHCVSLTKVGSQKYTNQHVFNFDNKMRMIKQLAFLLRHLPV